MEKNTTAGEGHILWDNFIPTTNKKMDKQSSQSRVKALPMK
jgi:hypothetical protein